MDAARFGLVCHVERPDHGDAELLELEAKVEVALQVGGIHHINHDVRPLIEDEVPRHYLVDGVRGETVDPREVGDEVVSPS